MFWLITITSTILVIVILLLPAIKMRDYEKSLIPSKKTKFKNSKIKLIFIK